MSNMPLETRSSTLGSIAMSPGHRFNCEAYKVSKSALNALTVEYAAQFAHEGLVFVAISPGVSSPYLFCNFSSWVAGACSFLDRHMLTWRWMDISG